jgi:peptidoglycan L-alanyl-D-glutamate endopeptidase CwlK
MPKFSRKSQEILFTCEEDLQVVMYDVVKITDITILSGKRGEVAQNDLFRRGLSKKMFPNSKHNSERNDILSQAVDIAPYPVNWEDLEKFYYVAGIVMGVAGMLGIELRWGGDWDQDDDLHDQTFMDLGHFELVR